MEKIEKNQRIGMKKSNMIRENDCECVCVCVCVSEGVCVCVCVCVWERERASESKRVMGHEPGETKRVKNSLNYLLLLISMKSSAHLLNKILISY